MINRNAPSTKFPYPTPVQLLLLSPRDENGNMPLKRRYCDRRRLRRGKEVTGNGSWLFHKTQMTAERAGRPSNVILEGGKHGSSKYDGVASRGPCPCVHVYQERGRVSRNDTARGGFKKRKEKIKINGSGACSTVQNGGEEGKWKHNQILQIARGIKRVRRRGGWEATEEGVGPDRAVQELSLNCTVLTSLFAPWVASFWVLP